MASCHLANISAVLVLAVLFQLLGQSEACSRIVSYGGVQQVYARCQDLPSQGAALAYTYYPATQILRAAFSGTAASPSGWMGWGINPTSWGMVGSSALVAFRAVNGSNVLPFKLTGALISGNRLVCSPVDITVVSRAVEIYGAQMTIFATLQLRPGQTSLNMIWNHGTSVVGFSPQPHALIPANLQGFTTIDVAL